VVIATNATTEKGPNGPDANPVPKKSPKNLLKISTKIKHSKKPSKPRKTIKKRIKTRKNHRKLQKNHRKPSKNRQKLAHSHNIALRFLTHDSRQTDQRDQIRDGHQGVQIIRNHPDEGN